MIMQHGCFGLGLCEHVPFVVTMCMLFRTVVIPPHDWFDTQMATRGQICPQPSFFLTTFFMYL